MDYASAYSGYGGGGFLPQSPVRGGDAPSRLGAGGVGGSLRDQRKTLLPARIADLVHATHDAVTNTFLLRDENEHHGVTISESTLLKVVAYVEELREQPLDLLWLLDDRSGEMIWARMASSNSSSLAELEQSGILVRAFGQLLEVDGRRILNVRAIRKADGEPELRYHESLCRLTKLQLIRGYPTATKTAAGGLRSPSKGAPDNGLPIMGQRNASMSMASAAPRQNADLEIPSVFSPEQLKILGCIRQKTSRDCDCTLDDIVASTGMGAATVRMVCEALQNEGHIYCTLDDDTFRASSA
ncbi:hypothetical protein CCYA_CCYA11G3001 [Cyanidiococcus yangmingshanensis]|uniref:Replication protein A C-terminal domain-containing protein n=1 Tax=Cyanidiococcus yangmingshanensis TaxID=2690220 RepID=A0A7J7IH13_9RHOD|nr:hypothetical protein F1559_004200 [Cyanidiococcus yangmingshanensis]KAK4532144.1 hypothetical protein CCYA_CCYA11G3001 [Cyanidiococcus yangmingshanensis]